MIVYRLHLDQQAIHQRVDMTDGKQVRAFAEAKIVGMMERENANLTKIARLEAENRELKRAMSPA